MESSLSYEKVKASQNRDKKRKGSDLHVKDKINDRIL